MFSDELKKLRNQKGLSQAQLADKLNVAASTIGMWESGKREPRDYETLELIADFFNVNMDALLSGSLRPNIIPVLGTVRAGLPMNAVENILDYEEISNDMARQGDFFALKIKGSSMEPRFAEGDIVIVKKQSDVDSGEIAIVLVNGDEATIKKVQKFNGGINLIPSNPIYEVLTFDNKQIENLPVQIIGKVVELRAKF
ncbi:MAG: XRE family transcriptional regulator [Clostridiales bacterium]|nr:XRE family transcriptional regulator [Clostridiales bacterium]